LGGTGDLPVADAGVPAVAMTLEQPRTVRLVFNSPVELADATLTVSLPDGLELAGFAGQREITWSTSLSAGKNVLALELIATSPLSGDVLATLRHADEQKTFRLRVDVNQDASLPLGQKMEIIA
ncbi:MAG: copper resistance protein CopC, partial [Gammaproteobacteria bacterium]|nr:copper resistance protein CopC [Gammaproteobacteria bacterium]